MSSFAWLDYSEQERNDMLRIIDQLKQPDTLDEMGIGSIRDAFADSFFPGTSTIQTRARYFFFVSWIYRNLEMKNTPSSKISKRARDEELDLIDILSKSEDPSGTIGIEARRSLKRLPSSIYWQGLAKWKIRLFDGSQSEYHRALDEYYSINKNKIDDPEELDFSDHKQPNWHASLPQTPNDFPFNASFALSREEAEYLRERIMSQCPHSLLSFLLDKEYLLTPIDFPWNHPYKSEFPPDIRTKLFHAQNFSEVIYGSILLYNLMLAEKTTHELGRQWEKDYNSDLKRWAHDLYLRKDELIQWDRDEFWKNAISCSEGVTRVTPHTMKFVNSWLDIALDSDSAKWIASNDSARQLIYGREYMLKHDLARLVNLRSLEIWKGASGTSQLNYRWNPSQRIIRDIVKGLRRTK
jgi:hypothetical protein